MSAKNFALDASSLHSVAVFLTALQMFVYVVMKVRRSISEISFTIHVSLFHIFQVGYQ